MTDVTHFTLRGHGGELSVTTWSDQEAPARYVQLISHGYGEHMGRYEWLADQLADDGALVYGVDHRGHGRSGGEPVAIYDFEQVVDDLHQVAERAVIDNPGLPVVLIGHSMGGMIAARFAQRWPQLLAGVLLSGPVIGRWDTVTQLLAADEIPDIPIDPETLSRDPRVGADYVADPLVWHGPFKRQTLQALQAEIDLINNGGRIDIPLLWLHGEDDRLVPYDGSATGWQRIRGAHSRQKSYPGARHEIFNETNRTEVVGDVKAFLAELLGRRVGSA